MSLKVELLTSKYVQVVAKLESELISKISESAIESSMKNESIHYFVLIDGDDVCGFLQCSILEPESELYEIGIDKKYQGKGYSKILMDYYLEFAKINSCDTIFLEVNNINIKAINLYKKYGFCEYGLRKNYYGSNQDAILMKLKI